MRKNQYIQPKVETMVMPEEAMMAKQQSPTDGTQDPNPAPARDPKLF